MREELGKVTVAGRVVIGEGERDEAPMLYIGEEVGSGKGPEIDIALDPLEGTTITAKGGPNALAVIAMGMILDSASIMLILVPLMLPVVAPLGVDLVWFGIVTVIAVEIGLLTPPFGIAVFTIRATLRRRDLPLGEIFAGAAPFAGAMLIALALVMLFPGLATALL